MYVTLLASNSTHTHTKLTNSLSHSHGVHVVVDHHHGVHMRTGKLHPTRETLDEHRKDAVGLIQTLSKAGTWCALLYILNRVVVLQVEPNLSL